MKTLNPAAASALRTLDRRLRREIEKNGPMLIWLGDGEFPRDKCKFRGLSVGNGRGGLSEWLGFTPPRPKRKEKPNAK